MSDDLKSTPDLPGSEQPKPRRKRKAPKDKGDARPVQDGEKSTNVNPIAIDETYRGLRDENRVVMRHNIALNLDNFRAAPEDFVARPQRSYPALQEVSPPFLSVIIPTFNGERHLPTVLNALRSQTFGDFEIIVVDDASNDDSAELVERTYPEARLIVNRRNQGFVRACNTAADAARGRFIVLLNNDTEPDPAWLSELVQTGVAHPEAAIITSKMLLFDRRDTLHTTGDLMGIDGIPRNRGVWERDSGQYDEKVAVFSGCGGATAYRKDVWLALGGFDEDFWMYLEDVDFGFRARLMGWEVVYAPGACVYHHLSASGGDVLASYYVGRNTIWTIAKNMPRGLLMRHWVDIVGAQVKIAIDAFMNVRGKAAQARLHGQLAGVLGLPRQLRKRRVIQPRRQIEDRDLEQLLMTLA